MSGQRPVTRQTALLIAYVEQDISALGAAHEAFWLATAFVRASWGLCHARGASARSEGEHARGAPRGLIGFGFASFGPLARQGRPDGH
jgi:hypothetical protein